MSQVPPPEPTDGDATAQPPAGHQPESEAPQAQQPPQPGYAQPGYGQPAYQQPGYQQPAYGQAGPGTLSPNDERMWGAAAHWSALVAGLVGGLTFLGPLIVMLTQGTKSGYVRRQAVESLNFQLSMFVYALISLVLMLVIIGFFLLVGVAIATLVLTIMGAVRASNGEDYRYPMTIRFIS